MTVNLQPSYSQMVRYPHENVGLAVSFGQKPELALVSPQETTLSQADSVALLQTQLSLYVVPYELHVVITQNRATMVSVKRDRHKYTLRIHTMFLRAPSAVIEALGKYIAQNDKSASKTLQAFIDGHEQVVHSILPVGSAQGKIHNLQEIYNELNQRYFSGGIKARIVWGARIAAKHKQRSIRMGSYSFEDRLIRIHPSLDRDFVPRYFVAWVVYHEMLHQKHDIPIVKGRRRYHTPQFLAEERLFDEHERAKHWERLHLGQLLHY